MILNFYTVFALTAIPLSILNKHIKMLLSSNTAYSLAFNTTLGIPIIEKDSSLENSAIKIIRDDKFFIIKHRSKYLCINESDLVLCNRPTKFELTKSRFGSKVSYNNKCLTFNQRLSFVECRDELLNQEFLFLLDTESCNSFIRFPLTKNEKLSTSTRENKKVQEVLDKKLKSMGVKNEKTKQTLKKLWSLGFKWPSFGIC